jgi:hypothetical protein
MDTFRSATAGGQSRQCKEARRSNIGTIASRADAAMAALASSPEAVALSKGPGGVAECVHAA